MLLRLVFPALKPFSYLGLPKRGDYRCEPLHKVGYYWRNLEEVSWLGVEINVRLTAGNVELDFRTKEAVI